MEDLHVYFTSFLQAVAGNPSLRIWFSYKKLSDDYKVDESHLGLHLCVHVTQVNTRPSDTQLKRVSSSEVVLWWMSMGGEHCVVYGQA